MDFSTLFRTKENLNLDKSTLTILRYIAILGQFAAINIVFFYLDLKFPIKETYIIIFIGLLTNLFLQFKIKVNQLKDTYASLFLLYDLFQLSALLYLTGGILNPFIILLIIPTIVSSTFLSMGTTIILGVITSFLLFLLTYTHLHLPLPGLDSEIFEVPNFYKQGILIAILIGLIFLSYFGIRFAGETKKRSEALNKLQEVISKEYELESLGGQAAAAAHSLGTPLATIAVVAKELKKEGDFSSLKIRLGRRNLDQDLKAIEAVRNQMSPDDDLLCDFNQVLSFTEALQRLKGLDDQGLYWFEEPIPYYELRNYAELRQNITTPLILGENFHGIDHATLSLELGSGDAIMPDLMRIGGISGWLKTAALAEAYTRPLSSHLYPEVSAHLMRVTPTADYLEWVNWGDPLLKEPYQVRDGHLSIPERPGVGLEFKQDVIDKYRIH